MANALSNLQASLERVKAIADDVDAHVQEALADSTVQARHETTLCAATVILSGFLESFLREIAEEMIAEICSRAVPFDQLPTKIRTTHYWEGAVQLRELARQERSANPLLLAKASDAARRLASVNGNQMPYEILWEAFADTQANPGPEEISTFLKRFDIAEPLPTLALAMGTTQNTLALALRSFMGVRNECAHTGSAKNKPTSTDVRSYCDLLELVGSGILTVFTEMLSSPPFVAPTPPLPAAPPP